MDNTDEILKRILFAKDSRSLLKKRLKDEGFASLSLSLNIAGYPKTTKEIATFFFLILEQFKIFLLANRIEIANEYNQLDEAGNFFLCSIIPDNRTIHSIKQLCEDFEDHHELGRIIDIDVADSEGNYISSGKNKLCIYCGSYSALECMRSKNHSYEDIRKYIFEKIESYLIVQKRDKVCSQLASLASRAILYEISLTPKPGLVDFSSSGVHKDMDFHSFIDSTAAIIPYFFKIAEKGFQFTQPLSYALPMIRETGLVMENEMFKVTKGVNTQKGIIFLMGVAVFSSAFQISSKGSFSLAEFSDFTKEIGLDVLNELDIKNFDTTHGKICVEKYGKSVGGGARQEVANGFSTAIVYGLPILDGCKLEKLNSSEKHTILLNTLTSLIANSNDTNVLYRSNLIVLEELKKLASNTLNSLSEEEKRHNFEILEEFCLKKKISPGGSADLLAITIFLHFVKKTNYHDC
ncbi:MAG: hypothetical protein EHM93_01280 [Bacteroidales bacterium]|nr:MAG: hypothetical protein EHM93_01280 [Bacteroidales bacterium]